MGLKNMETNMCVILGCLSIRIQFYQYDGRRFHVRSMCNTTLFLAKRDRNRLKYVCLFILAVTEAHLFLFLAYARHHAIIDNTQIIQQTATIYNDHQATTIVEVLLLLFLHNVCLCRLSNTDITMQYRAECVLCVCALDNITSVNPLEAS